MDILKGIVLDAFLKINKTRSTSAVFHLLTGKRSIQTISDVQIFKLEPYYKLLPKLNRIDYDKLIQELLDTECMIRIKETDSIQVSENGAAWLQHNKQLLH